MIDDKRQLLSAYNETIQRFPQSKGCRNSNLLPRASCLACKLGLTEEAFIDDVRGIAPDMTLSECRHAYRTASYKITPENSPMDFRLQSDRPTTPKYKQHPDYVKQMITIGRDISSLGDIMKLSNFPLGISREEVARQQLTWLFPRQDDLAYIYRTNPPTPGILGSSIRSVREWLSLSSTTPAWEAGELICPNPLTGQQGKTKDGKPSYISEDCLAARPHMVLEFDKLPLEDQCRFWGGFIRTSTLLLVCLTYSGGKSIHGCLYVGAGNQTKWETRRAQIIASMASSENAMYQVDTSAMRPRTGMRLAGAIRGDTGKEQQLLWLRRCPIANII